MGAFGGLIFSAFRGFWDLFGSFLGDFEVFLDAFWELFEGFLVAFGGLLNVSAGLLVDGCF